MSLNWVSRTLACLALVGLLGASATAAGTKEKTATPAEGFEQVELFSAMESGDIEVTIVPRDSRQATVVVKNNSGKPLSVRMPEGFAGVPALAQFGNQLGGGGFGGQGGIGGGQFGGGQQQALGGGFGGGGLGGGGLGGGGFGGQGGGGGGFFNVEPEKAAKVKVACVCLEHGKKEPNPSVKYKLVPLAKVTSDPKIAELCKMLARGEVDQTSAQVAAWHLANGMSFEQLAAKTIRRANGQITSYFSGGNIEAGMKIAYAAAMRAEQQKKSEGKSDSLSQN
jgi:hypothetical protein